MKLVTIKQFCSDNAAFSEPAMRSLVFNEKQNGLKKSGAIIRVGRKVLIDSDKFFDWVVTQNEGAA